MKKQISRLQYITTSAALAEEACKGGVDWIQLRLKDTSFDVFLSVAKEVQAVCKQYNAILIINDNVDVCLQIGADGVHLGNKDQAPEEARKLLGKGAIIGCTANTRNKIINLSTKEIDYIGIGPFRHTNTKKNLSPILGRLGFKRIIDSLREMSIDTPPLIGVGGITDTDILAILQTGIYGIAVSGAITNAPEITVAAQKLKTTIAQDLEIIHQGKQ